MEKLRVYQYSKCGTCRKALAWLERNEVAFEPIDIVEKPPAQAVLKWVLRSSGLPIRKLFNTSGQSYREGRFGARLPEMSEREALEALAADGKLIKRPIVLGEDFALVGFREEEYEKALR